MDITSSRFPLEVIKIIQDVAESHFIAFDLEFSGVAGRRAGGGKLTLQEYYEDTKAAAERYQILQVGLTVVKEDPKKGKYIARPYNFNLNPLPTLRERHFGRVWSFHSGAISFLMRNGFQFDRPLTQGVPYLSRKEERQAREAMIQDEEKRSKIPDMEFKEADGALISHIRSAVDRWQAPTKEAQERYLNVPVEGTTDPVPPSLNRYQVRLAHQVVRNEYPKLQTQGMGHFVQITNPNLEQQESERLLREQSRDTEIARAVGFRWLLEAIMAGDILKMPGDYLFSALPNHIKTRDGELPLQDFLNNLQHSLKQRRRVLVGHNCFTDLVNLYKCFIGDLPATVEEFQDSVHDLFPAVVDTKYMASFGNKRWGDTSLEGVETELKTEPVPRIDVPADFDRYHFAASYHEAGYDSLLTAKIAVKLSAKMEREAAYFKKEAASQMNQADSSQTAEFGHEEDGYVTAPESAGESEAQDGVAGTIAKAFSTPLTAVKMLLGKSEPNKVPLEDDEAGRGDDPSGVLANKEPKPRPAKRSEAAEIETIKNAMEKTDFYENLEKDPSWRAWEDQDPIPFSDKSSEDESPEKTKIIETMVKKGELMPRWNGGNQYWQQFGNKLQVNGCKEGVCKLA